MPYDLLCKGKEERVAPLFGTPTPNDIPGKHFNMHQWRAILLCCSLQVQKRLCRTKYTCMHARFQQTCNDQFSVYLFVCLLACLLVCPVG